MSESRLVYSSSRIAVAELLPFRDRQSEFCRSRFAEAYCNEEEILLAFRLMQAELIQCCDIKFRSDRISCFKQELF